MKKIIILLLMVLPALSFAQLSTQTLKDLDSQNNGKQFLKGNWNITSITIQGKERELKVPAGEVGPYIKIYEAEKADVYLFEKDTARWNFDQAKHILSLTNGKTIVEYDVEKLTNTDLWLKALGKFGDLDITYMKLRKEELKK